MQLLTRAGGQHAALLILLVVLVAPGSVARAGPITFDSNSADYTITASTTGAGTVSLGGNNPTFTLLSNGFTISAGQLQYTSVSADIGKTITMTYTATVPILSFVTGTYETTSGVLVNDGGTTTNSATNNPFLSVVVSTEWSTAQVASLSSATGIAGYNSGFGVWVYGDGTGGDSPTNDAFGSGNPFGTPAGSASLVETLTATFTVTAAGDLFRLGFDSTNVSEVSPAPEPASVVLLCLGGAGLAGFARKRRKECATA